MNDKLARIAIGQKCIVCGNYILENDAYENKYYCIDNKKFVHKPCVEKQTRNKSDY